VAVRHQVPACAQPADAATAPPCALILPEDALAVSVDFIPV